MVKVILFPLFGYEQIVGVEEEPVCCTAAGEDLLIATNKGALLFITPPFSSSSPYCLKVPSWHFRLVPSTYFCTVFILKFPSSGPFITLHSWIGKLSINVSLLS